MYTILSGVKLGGAHAVSHAPPLFLPCPEIYIANRFFLDESNPEISCLVPKYTPHFLAPIGALV